MRTKFLSLFIAVCLIAGLLPSTALAVGDSELYAVHTELNGDSFQLYGDIEEPTTVADVTDKITALPDYDDADEKDLSGIYAARDAYELLSDEEKAAVDADLLKKLENLLKLAEEIEQLLKDKAEEGLIEGDVEVEDRGKTLEVVVKETGTLMAVAEATEDYAQEKVTKLVISTEVGEFLNYADFAYIRSRFPNLKCLDITDADCLNDNDPENEVEHEIPNNAMNGKTVLETIILSTKVTSIAQGAFSGCTGLRGDLVIPDNITHLGKVAFGFWGSIYPTFDSITISKNMEIMEAGSFLRCKIKTGHVVIPASVTYMGGDGTYGGVFQETRLASVEFEEGSQLEYLGNYSFNGNSNMQGELKLSDKLTYIGSYAFSSCAKLTGTVEIPPSVKTIGGSSFSACSGLTGVVFNEGLESMGSSAFNACKGLSGELEFPGTLQSIGGSAFLNCTGLTGVVFNEGLESIGASAFSGCKGLSGELRFPDTLKSIGNSAFANCANATGAVFGEGIDSIGSSAFSGCTNLSGEVNFPETMSSIGTYAFQNCAKLTGLTMPKYLDTLGGYAFSGCSNMVCENLTIPHNLATIGTYAFNGCKNLTGTLTIPSAVTTIGGYAFQSTGISEIVFAGDGLIELGGSVFGSCANLTGRVELPQTLEKIGTSCLTSTNVSEIAYHGSGIKDLANTNYFGTLSSLETLDFSGSGVEKMTYTGAAAKLTTVNLPDTLKELSLTNKRALENIDLTECKDLTTVNLSSNAIDFSGGKPYEWLSSYEGTKTITGQDIFLYATRGETNRTIEMNGVFEDDFTITTKNGTDLSTKELWTSFSTEHQSNSDTTKRWITNNRLPAFPITRYPANYPANVQTDTAGDYKIIYSCTNNAGACKELFSELNYEVALTVGEGGAVTPAGTGTVTVTTNTGGTIGTGGLTKTYMDLPFVLGAKLGNNMVGAENITWNIYEDNQGAKGDNTSDKVLKLNENDMFEIVGAGTAWVTATVDGADGNPVTSAAKKIIVNRKALSMNLAAAKSKTYGASDAANFSFSLNVSANNRTETPKNITFTRDEGEDAGKYQIYLYSLEDLNLTKSPGEEGFWAEYKTQAIEKFKEDNPNLSLTLTVPADGAAGNYTINKKALAVSVSLSAKSYDGNAIAKTNTTTPVTGILTEEMGNGVNVQYEATFDSADVKRDETGKTIAQDGEVNVTLTGDKVKNYTLPSGYVSGEEKSNITWTVTGEGDDTTITVKRDGLTAQISPLSLSCYIKPLSKVYDGTAKTSFESVAALEKALTGLCEADKENIESITCEFADKDVGNDKPVTLVSDKINFNNYTVPTSLTASIKPRPLSVTGLTVADKVYDGTVDAEISGTPSISLDDVVEGDDVSIDQNGELKGEFYDRGVGDKKSVFVSTGFGLTGQDAHNYYLNPASTLYAHITPTTMIIIPDANQYKSLGALDPAFTYSADGVAANDRAANGALNSGILRGHISRTPGEEVGEYDFTLGSLVSSANYKLVLAEDAPKFMIRDTDATLKSISLSSGTFTSAFNSEAEDYTVRLNRGNRVVPVISAEANNSDATVSIANAASLEDSTIITVTAADGMTTKTYTISFFVAPAVSVNATVVNASSSGSDGMIIAGCSGGSGTYEFSLDNDIWQRERIFDEKEAGNYTLYVRDAEDPSNTAQISVVVGTQSGDGTVVSAPNTLTADQTSPVIPYSADSLDIELTAGGVEGAVYCYEINSGSGTLNGNILTVTEPGSITVSAKAIKSGIISSGSKELTLEVTKADKVSITAVTTDVTTYGGNNGKITVSALGGLGTYQYCIGNGSWSNSGAFSGLHAGTYTVFARDAEDIANITSENVTLEQAEATDAAAIHHVLDMLDLGDTSEVSDSLALPESESYGGKTVSISWETSDPDVIAVDGTVTQPSYSDGDKTVTLTATLNCNGIIRTKTFEVTVLKKPPHVHTYNSVVTAPNCTETGFTTYTCTECGHMYIDDYTDAKGHSLSQAVTAPTCTEMGYTTFTCTECGHTYIGDYTDVKEHNYEETIITSTCTGIGYTTYTCTDCGNSYISNEQAMAAHDYETVVTEPTCTELGYTTFTCKNCGETYRADEVSAKGHTPSEWIIDAPATIENEGSKHIECTDCQTVLRSDIIPQLVDENNSDEDGHSTVGDYSIIITDKDGNPVFDSEISIDQRDNITIKLPDGRLLDYEDKTTITVIRTETEEAAVGLNINVFDKSNNAATGQTDESGQLIVPNSQSSTGDDNGTIGDDNGETKYTYVVTVTDKNDMIISGCDVYIGENHDVVVKLPDSTAMDSDNRITVTVKDQNGEAVEGISVNVYNNIGDRTEITDSDGKVTILMPTIEPTQQPSETEKPNVTEQPSETEKPDVTEQPSETEKPNVTEQPSETEKPDVTEQPSETEKPDVTEQPSETEKPDATEQPSETEKPTPTITPGEGIEVITPDYSYKLSIIGNDGAINGTIVSVEEDGSVTIKLPDEKDITPDNRISIRITDKDGKPLKGVLVTVLAKDGTEVTDLTNSEGIAVVPPISTDITDINGYAQVVEGENSYNIIVEDAKAKIENAAVEIKDGKISVILPDGNKLNTANQTTVTVKDKNNKAVVNISVTVTDKDGKTVTKLTGVNGKITVPVKTSSGGGSGYVKPSYTVEVIDKDGKNVNVNKTVEDDKITLTLPSGKTLDDDYYTITVTDNNGKTVADIDVTLKDKNNSVSGKTDANGQLTMPATTDANDQPIMPTITNTHNPYVEGYDDGTFRPKNNMTRAEAAVIFARNIAERKGENISSLQSSFKDVSSKDWFNDYVAYLEKYEVISGYDDETFKANEQITRAEFVTMCMRFYELDGEAAAAKENIFNDVPKSHWASDYIYSAVGMGWINGYSDSTFKPDSNIIRAEVVTIVNRVTGRAADTEYINNNMSEVNKFTDLTDESYWAFYEILEASNTHKTVDGASGETWVK